MDFSADLREDVLSGVVTVSFRLWRRPKVKVGGRYRVGAGCIEVTALEQLPFGAISAADLRRSGEPDRESLRRRAAHAGPISDDTVLYRVAFRAVSDRV